MTPVCLGLPAWLWVRYSGYPAFPLIQVRHAAQHAANLAAAAATWMMWRQNASCGVLGRVGPHGYNP